MKVIDIQKLATATCVTMSVNHERAPLTFSGSIFIQDQHILMITYLDSRDGDAQLPSRH
jgi:hypothetical protein